MRNLFNIFAALLATVFITSSQAADVGAEAQTDDRYCTTCHGVEGRGNIGIQAPRLAGMEAWYLQRQLENYRAGIRGTHPDDEHGHAMRPMAVKLSDASIADLIKWIGEWEFVPAELTISGNVERGRTTYQTCATCHGADASGNEAIGAPALAGQNDWYLVTQLQNFKSGARGAHPDDSYGAQMGPMARMLPNDDVINDVVSFINTLR
jgi:cytochrome c553